MTWIKAIIIVFSTYSKIPMPEIKWDDSAMKSAFVFLPLVGGVIGLSLWIWTFISSYLALEDILSAAIMLSIPLFISGGIHLDGFCDTIDALAAWKDAEKSLEIMKDPHMGAFATMACSLYLIIKFAALHQILVLDLLKPLFWIYGLARCFAVFNALTLPAAKKDGMLVSFKSPLEINKAKIILTILSMFFISGFLIFSYEAGLYALTFAIFFTLWFRRTVKIRFNGATGDTMGFYQQLTELFLMVGLIVGGLL